MTSQTKEVSHKTLSKAISHSDQVLGGKPCIGGTRFPLAQLLAELTKHDIKDVAYEFGLNVHDAKRSLMELAYILDHHPEILLPFIDQNH